MDNITKLNFDNAIYCIGDIEDYVKNLNPEELTAEQVRNKIFEFIQNYKDSQ